MSRSAKGFTLIELMLVIAIAGIIASIALAPLLNARMAGNEASAIGSVRAIVSAEVDYNALNRGYATSLTTLSTLCPAMQVSFISPELNVNGVTKSGFKFIIANGAGGVAGPNDCNGVATQDAYYVQASPTSIGMTGRRGFATNQAGAIWQDTSGVPPAEPFTAAGTVAPIGR